MLALARRGLANLARKAYESLTFDTVNYAEWYQRNGYYRIAAKLGWNSRGARNITEDLALTCTPFIAGTKIISEDVGSLPLKLFEKTGDGRTELGDDPLYEKLHDEPNPETTAMEFRECLTGDAILCGNGYAEIVRSGDRVLAMWRIQPDRVEVKRNDRGALYYLVRGDPDRNKDRQIAFEDMLHLRGFTRNCVTGINMLHFARAAIGLMIDQEDYAARYFQEDAIPGIVLEHPLKLDDPEAVGEIKRQWKKEVKSHGVAVLQENMKATVIGKTNVDSQLVEQRRYAVLDACRLLRLPPHKLADLERATFSNIAEQNIQYYTETIRPWCTRWEQCIKLRLLRGRKGVYAEHSIDAFMRGDFESQSVALARLLEKGVWSINEVRKLFNLNSIKDGDQHFIQLNMQTVVDAANAEVETQQNSPRPQGVVELPRQQRVVRARA